MCHHPTLGPWTWTTSSWWVAGPGSPTLNPTPEMHPSPTGTPLSQRKSNIRGLSWEPFSAGLRSVILYLSVLLTMLILYILSLRPFFYKYLLDFFFSNLILLSHVLFQMGRNLLISHWHWTFTQCMHSPHLGAFWKSMLCILLPIFLLAVCLSLCLVLCSQPSN